MKRRLVVFPEADRDVDRLASFIARSNLAASLRFYEAVARSCSRLLDFPESTAIYGLTDEAIADLRAAPVRGFPNHLIFYRIRHEVVQVVRIIHGARDISTELRDPESPD